MAVKKQILNFEVLVVVKWCTCRKDPRTDKEQCTKQYLNWKNGEEQAEGQRIKRAQHCDNPALSKEWKQTVNPPLETWSLSYILQHLIRERITCTVGHFDRNARPWPIFLKGVTCTAYCGHCSGKWASLILLLQFITSFGNGQNAQDTGIRFESCSCSLWYHTQPNEVFSSCLVFQHYVSYLSVCKSLSQVSQTNKVWDHFICAVLQVHQKLASAGHAAL